MREYRSKTPSPPQTRRTEALPESALRAILGPLDPGGTRLSVRDRLEAEAVLDSVARVARKHPQSVSLTERRREGDRFLATLRVDSREYPLEVGWLERAEPASRQGEGPRLALVIDDLGTSEAQARSFLELEVPVTPAVIPYLPASVRVAHLARERGREFLLHLPMQPRGYPAKNPGEGALLEGMSETEVRRRLAEALSSVPGAAGVNNHMGSRLTELRSPMVWVMDELRRRDLYFLDSLTSPRSVAAKAAQEAGVGWVLRDVFLDNEEDAAAVGRQIEKAVEKAKASGAAVAIGHPHPTTLEALRLWGPKIRAAGVEVVPLGQLIRSGEG